MSHLEALSSHKRRTENEDREWVLLLLAGSALLPQRTSLWTCAQSCSCTEMPRARPPFELLLTGPPARGTGAQLPRVSKRNVHFYHFLNLRIRLFLRFLFFSG